MHHHEHDHEHEDCIRIHVGSGSVPGGSSSEILECRPAQWASDHALAALREVRRMLSWIESREPVETKKFPRAE